MSRLARRGHQVLYIDPDWSADELSGRDAVRGLNLASSGLGLRRVSEQLHVFTYHYTPLLRWRLNHRRWQRGWAVAAIAKRLGFSHPVAISLRPDTGLLMRAVRPHGQLYYAVDEWTGFADRDEDKARWRSSEESLLRQVDLALCVSPRLLQRFKQLQPRSYLLENGADIEHFSPEHLTCSVPHPALVALPLPRLGFIGQIDRRLDQNLVVEIARRRRDWQIVLAGRVQPGTDVSCLCAEPNITLLGYQPYDALPGVLRDIQVCLVPYRLTELTDSCNPLKVFEYLATGRPVISRPLEGLRATRPGVMLASTADEFIAAAEEAIAAPERGRAERLSLAAANTWEVRVDALEAYLREAAHAARTRASRPTTLPAAPRPVGMWRRRNHVLSWRSRLAFAAIGTAGWAYYGARVCLRVLRGQRHPTVRHILVVRPNAFLGDVLVLMPTLARLRTRFPEAKIVLGAFPGPPPEALLQSVDEVLILSDVFAPTARLDRARVVRQFAAGFDVVLSGSGYFLHREILWCGAPYRIGLDEGEFLEALNTHAIPFDATQHETENNLALADALCGFDPDERVPRLVLDDRAVSRAYDAIREQLPLAPGCIITMHAGSKRPSRRWPPERYAELATRLLEEDGDLQVVFSGVPDEAPLVEHIRRMIPERLRARSFSAAGETDLIGLIGLLDNSDVVVSNDTGTMHLARTRGTPLVALLGPENDRLWGPHPQGPAPAIALRHEVPCAPCRRFSCELMACMKLLTVDEAHSAVRDLLDNCFARSPDATALIRRGHRHDWRSVARGYEPPLTTVVSHLVPDASPASVDAQVQAAFESVAAQIYPALEWVILAGPGIVLRRIPEPHGVAVKLLRTDVNGNRWREAAEHAAGTFVAIMQPGVRWGQQQIAGDVATLLRKPELVACEHISRTGCTTLPSDPQGSTIRRDALLSGFQTADRPRITRLRQADPPGPPGR